MNKILVLNAGSSSIKFQLFDLNLNLISKGLCERIFIDGAFEITNVLTNEKIQKSTPLSNHKDALKCILNHLISLKIIENFEEIIGAGHRVVQGGNYFNDSVFVDNNVLNKIIEYSKLAPLHNKHEADVIIDLLDLIPNCKNVAVFDTTFHSTMPEINYRYAIPLEWESKYLVRRYGAHGTSFHFVTENMQNYLNKKDLNMIICHLGNGASICAVKNGKSYNTSMGFTPLEGLIMGTRSGDIDPSVIDYLSEELNKSSKDITNFLNKKSGMLALTGSSDMRDIFRDKVKNKVAIEMYAQRVANYVISYANQLCGKIDGIVFTAGIGENCTPIIEKIIEFLPLLNLAYDQDALNDLSYTNIKKISNNNSKYNLYQVRTNEELMIAKNVLRFL
ncbi:acetate kinase [Mycoplasmoides alvi]|uniref:acetate kinase n=1 Tax=Mycoplasmoides alvi TaxID=78580 RepID=UPI00051C6789|nr:acetate kinase [Mycoplasmoides alvi]